MSTSLSTPTTAELFSRVNERSVQKHSNYFEVYDRYLERFRGKNPTIVEIGVQHGGSLQMWEHYFQSEVQVVGIDILEDCRRFASDKVKIFIGDQSDPCFLDSVIDAVGGADLIIDDGSHIPVHQIASFEHLFFKLLKDGGVYICEDCHTSYWGAYGGGIRKRGSFIEYAKRMCDQINAWHSESRSFVVDEATRSIKSVTFYPSIVVFEKGLIERPKRVEAGEVKLDLERQFKAGPLASFVLRLKQNKFVQRLVRTNPALWRLMRKVLNKGGSGS